MYSDKIKAELLKKIALLNKVEEELEKKTTEYEKIYGEDPDWGEIEKVDPEVYNLFDRHISLFDKEIPELMMKTKFCPLCGLAPHHLEVLEKYGGPQFWKNVSNSAGEKKDILVHEDMIEKYLESELENNRESMKKRIGLLRSIILDFQLDSWTRYLYRQATLLFVYGFFESCIVLTRAIAESIGREYIELKGLGHLFEVKDKTSRIPSVAYVLQYECKVNQTVINLYKKISKKANLVLHKRESSISEEEALSSIETLYSFIQTFPRDLIKNTK